MHRAPRRVHGAGAADADAERAVNGATRRRQRLARQGGQASHKGVVGRKAGRSRLGTAQDGAGRRYGRGGDLGAPDVDADERSI